MATRMMITNCQMVERQKASGTSVRPGRKLCRVWCVTMAAPVTSAPSVLKIRNASLRPTAASSEIQVAPLLPASVSLILSPISEIVFMTFAWVRETATCSATALLHMCLTARTLELPLRTGGPQPSVVSFY